MHFSLQPESRIVDVQIETTLSEAWVHCFADFSNYTARTKAALVSILRNILPECCFVTLRVDNQPVACGLGVVERTWIGLFDIVTATSVRGRGYGTQLLEAILAWGKEMGAEMAYLQVMDDNLPARRLYDKLGFSEIYPYWYRVAPRT
jgi:GNAT superfamily N-acetyltransferase